MMNREGTALGENFDRLRCQDEEFIERPHHCSQHFYFCCIKCTMTNKSLMLASITNSARRHPNEMSPIVKLLM